MSELSLKVDHKLIRELMESDHEFAVEVKKGILRSAIKHYSASIWDAASASETRRMVKEEIGEIIGNWAPSLVLSPNLISKINEKLEPQIKELSNKTADEITERCSKTIDELVNKRIAYYVTTQFEKKMENIITERMKATIDKLLEATIKNAFKEN